MLISLHDIALNMVLSVSTKNPVNVSASGKCYGEELVFKHSGERKVQCATKGEVLRRKVKFRCNTASGVRRKVPITRIVLSTTRSKVA